MLTQYVLSDSKQIAEEFFALCPAAIQARRWIMSRYLYRPKDTYKGGGGGSPGENFAGKILPLRKLAKFSPGEILAQQHLHHSC